MSDLEISLSKKLRDELPREGYDLLDLVKIPESNNLMVQLRTLEEIIDDFDTSTEEKPGPVVHYLVRVAPAPEKPKKEAEVYQGKREDDLIYTEQGKLRVSYLLENANILLKAGDTKLAHNIFQAVHKSGEMTAAALFGIARCLEVDGKESEARKAFEDSIAFEPTLEAFQGLASLMIRSKKDQYAAEVLERAIHLEKLTQNTYLDLHKTCGNCWMRVQNVTKAELHYKKALELDPSADEIHSNLGSLYIQAGRIREAKKAFEDSIAQNPSNEKALFGLGCCLLAEGKKIEGHDRLIESLEIEMNNPTAVFFLVKTAYELKKFDRAEKIVSKYVSQAPVNINLLYSLGGMYFHLNQKDRAREVAQKVLDLKTDHRGAKELLELIERQM